MPRRVLESLEHLRLHLSLKTLDMEIPPAIMGGLPSLERPRLNLSLRTLDLKIQIPPAMMSRLPSLEIWTEVTSDELKEHIDTIEEAYEFFLGYAAQGVSGSGAGISGELSRYLSRADQALTAFESGIGDAAEGQDAEAVARMDQVLQRDASNTLAALRLVTAQPSISSQLIDNLNASIHFRAVLTDLFLVDEALKASATTS